MKLIKPGVQASAEMTNLLQNMERCEANNVFYHHYDLSMLHCEWLP